jgi:flagellar assembly protein FliH
MVGKGPRRIIPAEEVKDLQVFNFRSFTQRPVNYLIDVISDHTVDINAGFTDEEIDSRVKSQVATERDRLAQQFERRAEQQYNAGLQRGREEATTELKRAIDLLQQYAVLLKQEKDEISVRYEREVLDLAFQLAEKILGREFEQRPESVIDVARKAVQQVVDSENIKLRVNPDDLDYIKSIYADLESMLSSGAKLDLRAEPTIERGGCIVETEGGTLDARIASQLETLKSNLDIDTTNR